MFATSPKVKTTHLERRAVVYLRQSTMKQVYEHGESTARQYALKQRAVDIGWSPDDVEVIDDDLGLSGTGVEWRSGFKRLAEGVSQGQVGLIIALEVSRFARCSADWHHLLDLCGWTDVLIADEQGVYSPNDPNDRLLLGLKGQMSEAERYWMRLRLHGAAQSKARRGELGFIAPTGYVWDRAAQRLQLDPDEEVQSGVRLIFERFRIEGSAGGVVAYLAQHRVTFPIRRSGDTEPVRKRPHRKTVLGILHSPLYAGAYVWGRRDHHARFVDGALRRGESRPLPRDAWKVCIPDRHPAYITWEEYLSNQDRLEANRNRRREPAQRGAARKGKAVLQGLVLCGRCGYRMTVMQGGRDAARYICTAPQQHGDSTKACWSLAAPAIDAEVARQLLEAVQPPEVELSLAVMREAERQAAELERQWKLRLERASYEARLAERRYKAVDPDNRVVARTLETQWEEKLRELARLEEEYERARRREKVELSEADRAEILALSRDLPRVWSAATTTNVQRKNLLRLLVQQVTLTPVEVPRRMTRVQILWHTGAVTEASVDRPLRVPGRSASPEAVEHIRRRAAEDWRDREIAADLNRAGLRTATGKAWTAATVACTRKRRDIRRPSTRPPDERVPARRDDGLVSVRGVAELHGVAERTVYDWVERGHVAPAEGGGHGQPMWFSPEAVAERPPPRWPRER